AHRLERETAMLIQNHARRVLENKATMDQYGLWVETGRMSVNDYVKQQQNQANLQLTTLSTEMAAIAQANELVFKQFSADLNSFQVTADLLYKDIMLDAGVNESLLSQASDFYEMEMAPYHQQLTAWGLEQDVLAQEEASDQAWVANQISIATLSIQAIMTAAMLFM
ncbi:unnamed protein product, partial [marine sediment metagenome]